MASMVFHKLKSVEGNANVTQGNSENKNMSAGQQAGMLVTNVKNIRAEYFVRFDL
jgi:hypothetical protein